MIVHPDLITGFPVVTVTQRHFVQVKFPRSRKRRIRRKWAKRTPRNLARYFAPRYLLADGEAVQVGGVFYMNPVTLGALQAALKEA